VHLNSDLGSFLHGQSLATALKARDVKGTPQQRGKKKGLVPVNILEGFITGQRRQDVPGVASQGVWFRLQ